ncbi:arrestin domain-containing protein 3-like [Cottoperca gobio]|uniref:Arrestin domain-containing protein 3-like n=1 Tax=Cottoperca gobio TaxID=56716 RepID=A0A6J2QD45_COTGO|nr:arrestin domain-containing protein 3-like [Cottoperca gobio]
MLQSTVKNFKINFNVARSTFSSGDLIAGHITFDLTKKTKITSITMALTGKANVRWSTGGGKNRHKKVYSAKLEFVNFKSVIVQENRITGEAATFQPGTHVYPFTCQFPHGNFPSTFHGVHGHITYSLTVGVHRAWHMAKDFVTELNFVNRINTDQPELHAPLSGSNNMTLCCLWCASDPITMTVSLEKKAFIPGETVKIICEFSNASSWTVTPKVTLQQKQVYYTLSKASRRMLFKNVVSVTGQPVCAHTHDVHTSILLTIPPSTTLTVSNCSIIDVDYIIEVSLSTRASANLTVLFPIIMCDTTVDAYPPPYFFSPSK